MANTKSAKKMVRKIAKKTAINKPRKSKVRTLYKNVENLIAKGDLSAATSALSKADKEGQRAADKNIFKKKTVSRKISRLAVKIKKASSASDKNQSVKSAS